MTGIALETLDSLIDALVAALDGTEPAAAPSVALAARKAFLENHRQPLRERFRAEVESLLLQAEAAHLSAVRVSHFERLVIKRFSFLFEDGLSRRMIPGFNNALVQMLGAENYRRCQSRAQEIVDRHKDANGAIQRWAPVYEDSDTRYLVNDVLVHLAGRFGDMEATLSWLLDQIEAHMPEAPKDAPDADFAMAQDLMLRVLANLYADLRAGMKADKGADVAERYGQKSVSILSQLFSTLEFYGV